MVGEETFNRKERRERREGKIRGWVGDWEEVCFGGGVWDWVEKAGREPRPTKIEGL